MRPQIETQFYMCDISTNFSFFFIEHFPPSEATAPLKKGFKNVPVVKMHYFLFISEFSCGWH